MCSTLIFVPLSCSYALETKAVMKKYGRSGTWIFSFMCYLFPDLVISQSLDPSWPPYRVSAPTFTRKIWKWYCKRQKCWSVIKVGKNIIKILRAKNIEVLKCSLCEGGYGYRSTGQNINGPNINELQINCSIGQ